MQKIHSRECICTNIYAIKYCKISWKLFRYLISREQNQAKEETRSEYIQTSKKKKVNGPAAISFSSFI